jgi:PAS domain S-box-containing protein
MWAADGDVSGWWIGIAAVVGAAGTALATIMAGWWKEKKTRRSDALEEWREIANTQQEEMDRRKLEMDAVHKTLHEVQTSEAECRVKVARLEGEIKLLEMTVRRMQRNMGDDLPAITAPGVIVADINGMIQVASPSLTPLLHYLPHELRGKSVEVLMPDRYKADHRKALAAVGATGTPPWTERVILGEALTKEGEEVPVTISLSGWQTAKGDWLISAEIRARRSSVSSVSSGDSGILLGKR